MQEFGYDVVPINPVAKGSRILGAHVHKRLSDVSGARGGVEGWRVVFGAVVLVDGACVCVLACLAALWLCEADMRVCMTCVACMVLMLCVLRRSVGCVCCVSVGGGVCWCGEGSG